MDDPVINDLITVLQPIFVGRKFVIPEENRLVIKDAAVLMPLIDVEINEEIIKVGKKHDLRTGQIAWKFTNGDIIVQIYPELKRATIREGHWSTNKNDSHTVNDADSTYAVISAQGEMLQMFNTKQEAEQFLKTIGG